MASDGTIKHGSSNSNCVDVYVGGIVGKNNGTVRNCSNAAEVKITSAGNSATFGAVNRCGGIAGRNGGTISCCYNTGSVKNGHYSGGIAGSNELTLENCFNTGTVYAVGTDLGEKISYAGGLCGANTGTLSNGYNVGRVVDAAESPCVSLSTGTVTDCYYYDRALDSDDFTDGLSTEQMRTEQTFEGFDFSEVWVLDARSDYPFPALRSAAQPGFPEDTTLFDGGSGTPWSPYLISTAEHLANVAKFPEACYQLTENISIPETWEPFGFNGYFDGDGYTVTNRNDCEISATEYADYEISIFGSNSGLICDLKLVLEQEVSYPLTHTSSAIYVGGLAATNLGTIRNCEVAGTLTVRGGSTGYAYVGGIAACNMGTISECTNSAAITADRDCVGGIAGSAAGYVTATISDCTNTAAITSDDGCAGGIIGSAAGTISGCTNTGNITASSERYDEIGNVRVGGIAGRLSGGAAFDCVNSGKITAGVYTRHQSGYGYCKGTWYARAGGIVGRWEPSNKASSTVEQVISGCVNSGAVDASAGWAYNSVATGSKKFAFSGGICGIVSTEEGSGSIKDCANSGTITATYSSTGSYPYSGGICGEYYGKITRCRNSGSATFGIAENGTVSYCYNTGTTEKGLCKGHPTYSYDAGAASSSGTKTALYRIDTENTSYFLKDTPEQSSYTWSSSSEEQMRVQSTYTGFDFEKDWIVLPGSYPYPQLRSNLATPIKSIRIAQQPTAPVECVEGYFSSYNGMKLEIRFENGSTVVTDPWPECFSKLDTEKMGTQKIHLTLLGCKTDDTVEVLVREKGLASIRVDPPALTRYYKDAEAIDLTGAILYLEYDDSSTEPVALPADAVSGFVPGKLGTQTLTVTYGGRQCGFDVTVYDVEKIELKTQPTKKAYVQGQPLDPAGGMLTVTYTDLVSEDISLDQAAFSYDRNVIGGVKVTVDYKGKTTSFFIIVSARQAKSLNLESEPSKLVYAPFEALDLTGSRLKVVFESDDNYSETLTLSEDMISGFDNTTPGYQTLTVQYCGKTTTFLVQVQELVKSSSCTVTAAGAVRLSIDLNLSEQTDAMIAVCSYRNGQLIDLFLTTETAPHLTAVLEHSLVTDHCVLFLLDDTYCPVAGKQVLSLSAG